VESIALLFWIGDIVMSFRTSFYRGPILEARTNAIAQHYLKTWFSVDVLLIGVQLLRHLRDHSVFFKFIQVLRLLRLYKFLRFGRSVIERSTSNHVHLYVDFCTILIQFCIAVHFISCGWYSLGEATTGGWTEEEHMHGADIFYSYFASCRWTIAQVSGRTDLMTRTTGEYIYTVFACVFGILCMSIFISSVTNTMIELGALDRERRWQIRLLNGFLKRSQLSAAFALRVKSDFAAQQMIAIHFKREQEVLSVLPRQIMMDLVYEIRAPVLAVHPLFADLKLEFPRMLRHVCADAVRPVPVQVDEVVFTRGDACTRVLFIESGSLNYEWNARMPKARRTTRPTRQTGALEPTSPTTPGGTSRIRVRRPSLSSNASDFQQGPTLCGDIENGNPAPGVDVHADEICIGARSWLSEAALWVEWEHYGSLTASQRSLLLGLEVEEFTKVVKLFKGARIRAALYARAFHAFLERAPRPSDVMETLMEYMPTAAAPNGEAQLDENAGDTGFVSEYDAFNDC
jgi:hypothetical protein